jgi:hypothetical protein
MLELIKTAGVFLDGESFYWFCALAGTGLFVIQLVMTFVGDGLGEDLDVGNVKWLSRQALTGFLMMFGWTALTCRKEFGLSFFYVLVFSFAMGLLAICVSGSIIRLARRLQSPGSVFNIHDIVGKEGVTYQRVPLDGIGKVSISVNDMTQEIDAIAKEEIPSFTPVKIINVHDTKTVIIEKI